MKLWLLSQEQNEAYDTYDSLVVCAETESDAKAIRPDDYTWDQMKDGGRYAAFGNYGMWAWKIEEVKCRPIGEADPSVEPGVVIGSFNAG